MKFRSLGVLILAGAMMFSLAGCGSTSQDSGTQETAEAEADTDSGEDAEGTEEGEGESIEDALSEVPVMPSGKDVAESMIGKSIDKFIKEWGEPEESSKEPSCQNDGEDGIYKWDDVTVYTNSEEVGGEQIIQSAEE